MVEISTEEMLNEMLENMKVVKGAMAIIERQASQIKTLETQVASLMKLRHVDDVCPKCNETKDDLAQDVR